MGARQETIIDRVLTNMSTMTDDVILSLINHDGQTQRYTYKQLVTHALNWKLFYEITRILPVKVRS